MKTAIPRKFNCVAVLMGGPSTEREISLKSGRAVANGLREAGYRVYEIDVVERKLNIPPDVEAVFIALHGEFGEDGTVQSILNNMGIPYTGSGAIASAVAMDKVRSKQLFEQFNVPTPEYYVLYERERESRFTFPVVVKPSSQGSTIGVSLVRGAEEWDNSLVEAFKYGNKILVERYIHGREITVGIVNGKDLPVIEIRPKSGWYDFKSKYTSGYSEYIIPADLSSDLTLYCKEIALKAFNSLGCRHFGRVDMRISEYGEIFVLEVNTIPGFTETSLLPKAAFKSGMQFSELCSYIMEMAETD